MSTDLQIRPAYGIGTIARLTGISAHALRAWERRYDISANQRDSSGRRIYTQSDLNRLMLIKRLLDQGHRIGSLATVPTEILRQMLGTEHEEGLLRIVVVGGSGCRHIEAHQARFHRFQCELLSDIGQLADRSNKDIQAHPWLLLVAVENLSAEECTFIANAVRTLKPHYSQIIYAFGPPREIEKLQQMHVECTRTSPSLEVMESRIQYFLENWTDKDHIGVDQAPPRSFDDRQLEYLAEQIGTTDCGCPKHVTDLIRSLSSFEQYCSQCYVDDQEEASLHNEMNRFSGKARFFMEQAMQALVEYHSIDTKGEEVS